ncbi:hypothetical protein [Medusavirus stheno T3]|uniref:Uncharacterized protein n=1 Tax=Medusavirus stheno T3 TaxID=3069717 RepID=A0A7S7YFE7_9VIRU|nr:hypothetical protein QKU73_gp240 [Acanthamoeba castellanii medusavirus]QPB44535.1 hypothetical protein [Medusavirus stheno T3]
MQWRAETYNTICGHQPPSVPSKSAIFCWSNEHDCVTVYVIPDSKIDSGRRRLLEDCNGLVSQDDEEDHPRVKELADLLWNPDRLEWSEYKSDLRTVGVIRGNITAVYNFSE